MDCSTIIVSYNTFDLTQEAVRSAVRSGSSLEHEVVVVDNASPDGSGPRLKKEFADYGARVKVILNPENVGFSAANNAGARQSSGRILFFLNPDTVVHDDAVVKLVQFLDMHAEAGAIGPLVLNRDGTVQSSSFRRLSPGYILHQHFPVSTILGRTVDDRATGPVEIVYGAALAIRREVFDKIGGWDETYFMYAEETEMCYSLVQKGYVNYFVRDATITHFGGASSLDRYSEQMVLHNKNLVTFMTRHHSAALLMLHRVTGLSGFAIRVPVFALLELLRPGRKESYRRRRQAAWELAKWFALDFRGVEE